MTAGVSDRVAAGLAVAVLALVLGIWSSLVLGLGAVLDVLAGVLAPLLAIGSVVLSLVRHDHAVRHPWWLLALAIAAELERAGAAEKGDGMRGSGRASTWWVRLYGDRLLAIRRNTRRGRFTVDEETSLETAAALLSNALRRLEADDRIRHDALHDQLTGLLSPREVLTRLAGDEFVVLCRDVGSTAEVTQLAERISAAGSQPFALSAATVSVGASTGLAVGPRDGTDELLHRADLAMYAEKERRREREAASAADPVAASGGSAGGRRAAARLHR